VGLSQPTYDELVRLSDEIAVQEAAKLEAEEANYTTKKLEFYVCPTEGCPCYYGATGLPDLTQDWTGTHDNNYEPTPETARTRSQCWVCFERDGRRVEKIRMTVEVRVPRRGPPPTPRPTSGKHAA